MELDLFKAFDDYIESEDDEDDYLELDQLNENSQIPKGSELFFYLESISSTDDELVTDLTQEPDNP